ncbi:unnamed protein product, partial [Ectocarpus sp. 12 AP-2014]
LGIPPRICRTRHPDLAYVSSLSYACCGRHLGAESLEGKSHEETFHLVLTHETYRRYQRRRRPQQRHLKHVALYHPQFLILTASTRSNRQGVAHSSIVFLFCGWLVVWSPCPRGAD